MVERDAVVVSDNQLVVEVAKKAVVVGDVAR